MHIFLFKPPLSLKSMASTCYRWRSQFPIHNSKTWKLPKLKFFECWHQSTHEKLMLKPPNHWPFLQCCQSAKLESWHTNSSKLISTLLCHISSVCKYYWQLLSSNMFALCASYLQTVLHSSIKKWNCGWWWNDGNTYMHFFIYVISDSIVTF